MNTNRQPGSGLASAASTILGRAEMSSTRRLRIWAVVALLGAAYLGYLLPARPPIFVAIVAAAAGSGLAVLAWRRPDLGLLTVIALVPLNPIFYAKAVSVGVPAGLAGNLSYWKELIVIVLLAKGLRVSRTRWVDYVAFAYLGLVALSVLLPLARLVPINLFAELTAAREDAEFVAIFLIARHVPMPDSLGPRIEAVVMALGVFFAGLGIYSHFFPVEYWLFSVSHFGMGTTYFTTVFGGQTFVRAGMIFGSPVNLAFYLLISVAIGIARAVSNRPRFWYAVGGAVCAAAVLCTVTRSAIFAIPLMVALAMLVARRRTRVALVLILGVLAVYPLFGTAGVGEGVSAGVDPSNSETAGHLSALASGFVRIMANPLGGGLATAGHTAQRFEVLGAITPEDWYLQIGAELGVLGMLLFIALLVLTLRALWKGARAGQPQATAALLALTGIAACGIVLHSFEDLGVAVTVWALAGVALRADRPGMAAALIDDPSSRLRRNPQIKPFALLPHGAPSPRARGSGSPGFHPQAQPATSASPVGNGTPG